MPHGCLQLLMRRVESQCWSLLSGNSDRIQGNDKELHQERSDWEKVLEWEGQEYWSRLPWQWSWHQAAGIQEASGQCTQIYGLIFRWSCVEPGFGFRDPYESLSTWNILIPWFLLMWEIGAFLLYSCFFNFLHTSIMPKSFFSPFYIQLNASEMVFLCQIFILTEHSVYIYLSSIGWHMWKLFKCPLVTETHSKFLLYSTWETQ